MNKEERKCLCPKCLKKIRKIQADYMKKRRKEKKVVEEIPQFKGTLEELEKLKVK